VRFLTLYAASKTALSGEVGYPATDITLVSEENFRIIFSGRTAGALSVDEVRANLGNALKLSERQLDKLFSGKEFVVKSRLSREAAQKIQLAFARAGAVCVMRESTEVVGDIVSNAESAPAPPVVATGSGHSFRTEVSAAKKKLLMSIGGVTGIISFFALALLVTAPWERPSFSAPEKLEQSSPHIASNQVAHVLTKKTDKDICDGMRYGSPDYVAAANRRRLTRETCQHVKNTVSPHSAPIVREQIQANSSAPLTTSSRDETDDLAKCDTLAGDPYDPMKVGEGVEWEDLNTGRAIPACENAVRQSPNSPRYAYLLARVVIKAEDADRKFSRSKPLLLKAAEMGYSTAQFEASFYLFDGAAGFHKDTGEGIRWLTEAATGLAAAKHLLAMKYINGLHGINKDLTKGLAMMKEAALDGSIEAQYELGNTYRSGGHGVEIDLNEAIKWLEMTATQFQRSSLSRYSHLVFRSRVILGSLSEAQGEYQAAMKWYVLGADQHLPSVSMYADFPIGLLYEEGLGVKRNEEEAIKWYSKAHRKGHPDARKRLFAIDPEFRRRAREAKCDVIRARVSTMDPYKAQIALRVNGCAS